MCKRKKRWSRREKVRAGSGNESIRLPYVEEHGGGRDRKGGGGEGEEEGVY